MCTIHSNPSNPEESSFTGTHPFSGAAVDSWPMALALFREASELRLVDGLSRTSLMVPGPGPGPGGTGDQGKMWGLKR